MEPSHQAQVVELFWRLQNTSHGLYPPRNSVERHHGPGKEGLIQWLSKGEHSERLVFLAAPDGKLVGHVEIQSLAGKLSASESANWRLAFENQPARQGIEIGQLAAIKRLGVDPLWQSKGIGRLLLQEAIRLVREQMGQVPALVMIEDLHEARVLYQSEGAKMIGDFQEDGGNRMLSLVF